MTFFQISALTAEQFTPLFSFSDAALTARGMKRCAADASPGYPCRVSLQDAAVGETLLLLPFPHHETASPYRASGPIFVRQNAAQAHPAVGEVPDSVRRRRLSVRAYEASGDLADSRVTDGADLEAAIDALFSDPRVAFLHLHHAGHGCYSCRVDRAPLP